MEAAVDQTQGGARHLDTSQELVTLGRVGQAGARDAQRPETAREAVFVTEDESPGGVQRSVLLSHGVF